MKFINVIITLLLISNSWAATVLPLGNTNGSTKIFAATNSNVSIVTAGTGVTKISNNLRLTDGTETLPSAGINTQANTSLINLGINDQGSVLGTYNSANQGGMFRVDARAGQNLYTWFGQPASSSQATLMTLTNAGVLGVGASLGIRSSTLYSIGGLTPDLQIHSNGNGRGIGIVDWNNDGARLNLAGAASGAIGTFTALASGATLGIVNFLGADLLIILRDHRYMLKLLKHGLVHNMDLN